MQLKLPRISIVLFALLCPSLGVAPITSIHPALTNNERQNERNHVLYGPNNTLLMPSIDKSPSFDASSTSSNVTVLQGENAFLVCSVLNLGKHLVSWLRHNDINLLSVGKFKYTQNPRYQIFHNELNDTWTLKIRQANIEDSGYFQCQISTAPPVGHTILLNVIDPELKINGDADRFAKAGSNLNLTCYIRQITNEGKVLKWTHNDQEINHPPRGGVFIITEHNIATVSHLVIKNVTIADSGQYACSTSAKSRAYVTLHVINNDPMEADTVNKGIKTTTTFRVLFLYFLVNFIT